MPSTIEGGSIGQAIAFVEASAECGGQANAYAQVCDDGNAFAEVTID